VSWEELKTIASASTFKLKDMEARFAEPDPWGAYEESAAAITKAARAKLGLS
jgi:DNA primase